MKPDKQRIAIAEACGVVSKDHWGALYKTEQGYARDCPDYVYDLNAMHEAEKFIRKDHDVYGMYLQHLNRTAPECRVHATAAQKAEAFLKAVGKWQHE